MPWSKADRAKYDVIRERYSSDLSEAEFALIFPLLPAPKRRGRKPTCARKILNALFYLIRSGCPWRLLPKDFPPFTTVQNRFYAWRDSGLWTQIDSVLVMSAREAEGRDAAPTAVVVDSQSVKTTEAGGPRVFDAAKKIKGRKRHLARLPTDVAEPLPRLAAARSLLSRREANAVGSDWIAKLKVRAIGDEMKVVEHSGGNQQKVVIAKSLVQEPDLVIFDEPTRGVDVGAIVEIYELINRLADEGNAVVVISSYLPEIMALSDRILVTRHGKVVEEFSVLKTTEEKIMYAAIH